MDRRNPNHSGNHHKTKITTQFLLLIQILISVDLTQIHLILTLQHQLLLYLIAKIL